MTGARSKAEKVKKEPKASIFLSQNTSKCSKGHRGWLQGFPTGQSWDNLNIKEKWHLMTFSMCMCIQWVCVCSTVCTFNSVHTHPLKGVGGGGGRKWHLMTFSMWVCVCSTVCTHTLWRVWGGGGRKGKPLYKTIPVNKSRRNDRKSLFYNFQGNH